MTSSCPEFLKPRLRLFLSADIVGSTSLKQGRLQLKASGSQDARNGPAWFSAIQGFYFEAAQAMFQEWDAARACSEDAEELYGTSPVFWKSVGDEVLFAKELTDHRQLTTTLHCWFSAVRRMRKFLQRENGTLNVKCTAWLAGFPYVNREVVIGQRGALGSEIQDYHTASGELLNKFYEQEQVPDVVVDYIGPSIDTGFRISGLASSRKMAISVDVAYMLSMTTFHGELSQVDVFYDGLASLKGVMGGASYPAFWLDMSSPDSLEVMEDRLNQKQACREKHVKEFCEAYYARYSQYILKPFITGDTGRLFAKQPVGYGEFHENLVKNFWLGKSEGQLDDTGADALPSEAADEKELENFVATIKTEMDTES